MVVLEPTKAQSLETLLSEVSYRKLHKSYVPSEFALQFLAFIKLVNGPKGEENASPVFHLDMLDSVDDTNDNLFICFRGGAKTSVIHEYMFLYIATYGGLPNFGDIDVAMYVSDTIDNGVKNMRQNLEHRYKSSEFLKKYIPYTKFTDTRWEFHNNAGKKLCVRGFGASTGVRGFKEYGARPSLCGMDDMLSDKNAESPTITDDIRKVIYRAARQCLHPKKRKINWTGTPFNAKDPLYQAAASKAWNTKVFPICEEFPCTREEFIGAWEDRFSYDFVLNEYTTLLENGELAGFNQELMLRIMSTEDQVILDSDIRWYKRNSIVRNKAQFNFYITTDFATSASTGSDYSVISVWAYNNVGDWFWVDGVVKRQLMDKNIDDLFRLAQEYLPQQVGIEVSGQQGGFIPWIQKEMLRRNQYFPLASDSNSGKPGIRPVTNKLQRFNVTVPWFKLGRMYYPIELKKDPRVLEHTTELSLISPTAIKSRYDDCIDTISMLPLMTPWKPTEVSNADTSMDNGLWGDDTQHEHNDLDSYLC